jgi:3,4-dihydroxy-2-butanone 4-phosphate synthase/GTP cyclohydrolase II
VVSWHRHTPLTQAPIVKHAEILRQTVAARLPTRWATFDVFGFERERLGSRGGIETALALVLGNVQGGAPLLRIHSQCVTGELLGSLRCDCNAQLQMAMKAISQEGHGILVYEHQEGRGIGLVAKLKAYALQDAGLDTVEANRALGFEDDCRDFALPVAILHRLGIERVRLLSNNPRKAQALTDGGIAVDAIVPCEVTPTPHSVTYLRTKKERMGHLLTEKVLRQRVDAPPMATVEEAIGELTAGRMIVVVDDEDRENEGDLIMAAEKADADAINFMLKHGRGLVCLAMTGERLDALAIGPMTAQNTSSENTAFTTSVDLKGHGVTTGVSAHDRARTIAAMLDPGTRPQSLARPGHLFPLRARGGGVLERRGHTEAAVDLARLAGLAPAGVICEILNDDGTMARAPELAEFCMRHGLVMITVADLVRFRLAKGRFSIHERADQHAGQQPLVDALR